MAKSQPCGENPSCTARAGLAARAIPSVLERGVAMKIEKSCLSARVGSEDRGSQDGITTQQHTRHSLGVKRLTSMLMALAFVGVIAFVFATRSAAQKKKAATDPISDNAQQMVDQGRQIFRFATFGDEAFWGDTIKVHKAIEGSEFGGVGPGVSPAAALAVGLKVDVDALPRSVIKSLKK